MQVVHASPYTGIKQGGPSVVTSHLATALHGQGVAVRVVGQLWPNDIMVELPPTIDPCIVPTTDVSGFGYSPQLSQPMRDAMRESDLVQSHGLWMYLNYLAGKWSSAYGKPCVITPHGMMEPYILARSPFKKRIVRRLFQDQHVKNAACIQALCVPEANNIRALGFRTPISIIPNGVILEDYADMPSSVNYKEQYPHLKDRKILLFMSRIHPKKGLLHLVEAWAGLANQYHEWHLIVAGPDDLGHKSEVEQAIDERGISDRVTFAGTVSGDDKRALLAAADAFVLPSFSEGFSMAILEAMACRLPVLLTPGCNFSEAVEAGAAIEMQPNCMSTIEGLRQILEMTDSQRSSMGQHGYNLIASRYTWKKVAEDLIEVYKWCLGGGAPPASVWLK